LIFLTVERTEIPVISRADLIKNKRATGRTQDLADAQTIEKWKDTKNKTTNARGIKSQVHYSKQRDRRKSKNG
jgi:hypothetical protein